MKGDKVNIVASILNILVWQNKIGWLYVTFLETVCSGKSRSLGTIALDGRFSQM